MIDFPTLFDWLETFAFLRGFPAAYVALGVAAVVVLMRDWRILVLALTVHYLVTGLLFVEVMEPRLAIVKILVGLFVCLMLYVTGRQIDWEYVRASARPGRRLRVGPVSLPLLPVLRVVLTAVLLLLTLTVFQRPAYRLPAVPAPVNLAVVGLGGLGLLGLLVTTDPFKAGTGLLMLLTGFELTYNTRAQSVTVLVTLAATTLVLTLVIAYLAQWQHAPRPGTSKGQANT